MSLTARQVAAPSGRLGFLDGLRGVAAFAVVIDHMAAFLPGFVYDQAASGADGLGDLGQTILHFPVRAGAFSVFIFFVLPGFVIAKSVAGSHEFLPMRVVRRYLRLTVPM